MGMTIQVMTAFGPKKNPTVQVTASGEPRVTELPADLSVALEARAGARAAFDTFAPSRCRERVRQLEATKTQDTRIRRREKLLADLTIR